LGAKGKREDGNVKNNVRGVSSNGIIKLEENGCYCYVLGNFGRGKESGRGNKKKLKRKGRSYVMARGEIFEAKFPAINNEYICFKGKKWGFIKEKMRGSGGKTGRANGGLVGEDVIHAPIREKAKMWKVKGHGEEKIFGKDKTTRLRVSLEKAWSDWWRKGHERRGGKDR